MHGPNATVLIRKSLGFILRVLRISKFLPKTSNAYLTHQNFNYSDNFNFSISKVTMCFL